METQVTEDVYMPGRGQIESQRLNRQHNFLRRVAYGHLIQPSIPRSDLRTIADVGTGTGIWAQEVAEELESSPNPIECVGFDVSPEQFRKLEISQVQFVIHDVHTPFPSQYHEKFDLVNIRLLSYAIKANSVQTVVENIVQIIRPGGFLQWQECDIIDAWAIPETPNARATVTNILNERLARGLTPAIVSPVVKAIQSISAPIPSRTVSPLCWTGDQMRIMHLDTFSTADNPSELIRSETKQEMASVAILLLQAGITRRQMLAEQSHSSTPEAEQLQTEINARSQLLEAWKQGKDPANSEWNYAMTSIVARKAHIVDEQQDWMLAKN